MNRGFSGSTNYNYEALLGFGRFSSKLVADRVPVESSEDVTVVEVAGEDPIGLQFKIERQGGFFPLFDYQSTEEGGRASVLWRLYDLVSRVQDDGTEFQRQRVLWRLFHREATGPNVSTDFFPFIAMNRGPELKQFSFMGGLFGYKKKEGNKSFKFLWIPFGS